MYLYGGHDIREGPLDSLWAFDLEKMGNLSELSDTSPGPDTHAQMDWVKVETSGKSPGKITKQSLMIYLGPISHHQTAVMSDKMFVIGGTYSKSDNTTIYVLDLKQMRWNHFQATGLNADNDNIPVSLDEHTAVQDAPDSVVTFGGFVGGERSNHIHRYNLAARQWEAIPTMAPKPEPRAGHSAALHGRNMYIFGGKGEDNVKYNDFWSFNLDTKKWTQIAVEDDLSVPVARSGHASVAY